MAGWIFGERHPQPIASATCSEGPDAPLPTRGVGRVAQDCDLASKNTEENRLPPRPHSHPKDSLLEPSRSRRAGCVVHSSKPEVSCLRSGGGSCLRSGGGLRCPCWLRL